MKHALTAEEKKVLDQRIAETEKRTGAQVVLAVVERSDAYPEIPWKAFALGASLAGLLAFLMNVRGGQALPGQAAFLSIVMTLAAGAGLALLAVLEPNFAKLFLAGHRAEVETRQYAESLFLSRELFATPGRKAVLLLVSVFERRMVVLPDTGLVSQLDDAAVEKIIEAMRPELTARRTAQAFLAGLKCLEENISVVDTSGGPANTLPNEVIEEKGP